MLCITNLPPEIRMDLRYLIIAGVWQGPGKPDMSIILQPILEKLRFLYEKGITISTTVGNRCLRAKLLCCVFDFPARCMALNMMQWNGRYGCTCCLDEGKQLSHVRVYLPDDEHTARSERDLLKCSTKSFCQFPCIWCEGVLSTLSIP